MSQEQTPVAIIDRLRTNLRAAGISITEEDITGMIDKGFLARVVLFEQLVADMPMDQVPDYLSSWSPMSARDVVAEGLGEQSAAYATGTAPGGLRGGTIAEVARRIKSGDVLAVELTEEALALIAEHDLELNAFQLVLADRAREAARQADTEIAAGNYRGPLHGVPLAIKDLMALEGTITSAGSKILSDWTTGFDSAIAERLQAAGAIIVGKTRMSEFAYSPGSNNAHYNATHNPWNPEHDAGGSSSGSAAAVAAGLVFGAIGSDTGGSIRIPASLCGVVGLKPTFGRVSLHGAVTLSWSLDHGGPLTRSVTDAAILLEALAGYDPRDPRSRHGSEFKMAPGELERGVSGLRIGVLREDGTGKALGKPEIVTAWQEGLAVLERAGATLVEIDLPEIEATRLLNSSILALEAATYHQPNLAARLDDYGEFMRHRILSSYAHGPVAFVRSGQARAQVRRVCDAIFERVDLLSTPTMPYGAPLLGVPAATTFTAPFNTLGWPAISVPVGLTPETLPIGLQLAARPWDEATLLRAAYAVEAAGLFRQKS